MVIHAFKRGDRVELVRYYSFWGEPLPQGTVISATDRTILTKMDRNSRMIRLSPFGANSSLHKIAQGGEIAELDAEVARLGGY